MGGVSSEAVHRWNDGKHCIDCRRGNAHRRVHEPPTQEENECDCSNVHQKEAQMDSGACLSKDRHYHRIGTASPTRGASPFGLLSSFLTFTVVFNPRFEYETGRDGEDHDGDTAKISMSETEKRRSGDAARKIMNEAAKRRNGETA